MKECIEHGWYQGASAAEFIFRGVGKGIPLPKNHGKLIDASQLYTVTEYSPLNKIERCYVLYEDIENAPTILEAEVENDR